MRVEDYYPQGQVLVGAAATLLHGSAGGRSDT